MIREIFTPNSVTPLDILMKLIMKTWICYLNKKSERFGFCVIVCDLIHCVWSNQNLKSKCVLLCSVYEMVTQHMKAFCWKLFPHTLHISASFSPWEGKLVKLLNLRNLPPQMLLPEFQTEWWSCFVIWFSLLTSCVWKFPSLYLVETCYECDCQYYFMS